MKGPAMFETWSQPATWVSLATLSAMEIVLGLDNVVFLSILAGKLPPERQPAARRIGLALALGNEVGVPLSIGTVVQQLLDAARAARPLSLHARCQAET